MTYQLLLSSMMNDELFYRRHLYEVAKPVVEAVLSIVIDAVATSVGAPQA